MEHSNVTIRNVRVLGTSHYGIWVPPDLGSQVKGLLIEDVEIKGVSGSRSAGLVHYGRWTARRVDISGYQDAVKMGTGQRLEASWLHDLYHPEGAHNDGVQVQSGSGGVIRGNNIENPFTQTSAIMLQTNFGPISDYVIEGNRLSGGGYTMYIEDKGNGYGAPRNVRVLDNVWDLDSWKWGPLETKNRHSSLSFVGNQFSDGSPYNP